MSRIVMKRITKFGLLAVFVSISGIAVIAQSNELLIKNATILTAAKGTLENTDILVRDGKIAKIGKNLSSGNGARVIDATGKYVSPGIIDAHSHTMIDGQVNEGSLAVTSMTRIGDVLGSTDIAIYRAIA